MVLGMTSFVCFILFIGMVDVMVEATTCDYSKVGFWTTCGRKNTTRQECGRIGCCYASDTFRSSKNMTQNCVKPPPSFVWKNGTCSIYNSTVCVPYLGNKTYGQLTFFDTRYGVRGTEAILKEFTYVSTISVKEVAQCRKLIPAAICHTMLPPCNQNGRPTLSCREDCDEIMRICSKDMDRFYGALEFYIKQRSIDFSHLSIPTCPDLKYSYDYDKSKNESCNFIGLFDHSKKTKKSMTTIIIIAACCSAAVLIGVLIAIVILCKRREKLKRNKMAVEKDLELFSSYTTVRDRIRQDSIPNPVLEALSHLSPDEKPPQCCLDNVEYVQDLGQGQFGKVFQGRFSFKEDMTELSVAVKVLKEGSSPEVKDSFIQEVTLMSVLNHENILKLIAVSTEEEPFCMVFEFMVNGDLNQYLRKNDPENTMEPEKVPLPYGVLVNFAKQIAEGMDYIGSKKLVHRDLATRNCLVGDDFLVKIADFGMSRDIYDSEYYKVGGAAMLPIRWMPPEALLYGKFTVESDVYSYGILMWEIFTYALQPFYGYSNDEVVKFVKKGVILPRPDLCPQQMYEHVMTKCWARELDKRLTFKEIVKRLDGDYDYVDERPKKRQKKDTVPNYSVPPSAQRASKDGKATKHESRGKDGSLPDYQNFKPQELGDVDFGVRGDNGSMQNPSFKTGAFDDLYDRPKSHSYTESEDIQENETIRMPLPNASLSSGTTNGSFLYSVPKGIDEDIMDNEEYENITKKRYISSNDVQRLSKKSSKSSVKSNNSVQ